MVKNPGTIPQKWFKKKKSQAREFSKVANGKTKHQEPLSFACAVSEIKFNTRWLGTTADVWNLSEKCINHSGKLTNNPERFKRTLKPGGHISPQWPHRQNTGAFLLINNYLAVREGTWAIGWSSNFVIASVLEKKIVYGAGEKKLVQKVSTRNGF